MELKETIARELEVVRTRSLSIVDPLPEDQQIKQHSKLMSPMVWDIAHVGNYEDIWLLRGLEAPGVGERYDDIYNAFLTPRDERTRLPMLGPGEARGYIADVRGRVLDHLERTDLDTERALVRDGFVYGMVIQHEHQHGETLLATANLMSDYSRFATVATPAPATGAPPAHDEVLVSAGAYTMGTDAHPWAYDNERRAHTVDLRAFWIDATPVTNAQYLRFVLDGGYDDARHWTEAGWKWRTKSGAEHPEFWQRDGEGSWSVRRFGRSEALNPHQPVQHVCWFEADAFARWAGKRLPTEAEWEAAASCEPGGRKRVYPWGDDEPSETTANLAQRHYEPAAAGAYPEGVSPWGCHQMLGDVWEWTSSDFLPYPGFASFPYVEYSEVFFGSKYKVLRGGSWATHPSAVRCTFRNWDFPIRRQIFAGFRCARDA